MKALLWIIVILIVLIGGFFVLNAYIYNEKQQDTSMNNTSVQVIPIAHASLILNWGGKAVYADPVGNISMYANQPDADVVLITHEHGDHYSTSTLSGIVKDKTVLVVPQSIADILPESLKRNLVIVNNGEVRQVMGINIQGVPMYNLREEDINRHPKGKWTGYVLEAGDNRVYIAGDTEDIPEMRALQDIDIAFVPMNLPFTMSVEKASEAVLDFKPRQVYPYHYRTPSGLSDVGKFKQLVNVGDPNIEVVQLNWYPQ
jgi:L-ascorbate metabolism protein UlaG (beta-lactamase superfamily)